MSAQPRSQHSIGTIDLSESVRARVRPWSEFRQQADFSFRMAGWLPKKGVAVLGAAEHSGKSILAVDWALRCVLGENAAPWCEHPVRAACSSLYVIGEDAPGIKLRVQAFVQERVGGKFGEAFRETLTSDGLTINFVDKMPGPLCQPEGIAELRALLEDFRHRNGHYPGIVWLDTSSTLYGGDENDNAAMGQFAKALSEISDDYDLLVVLIHHLRKPNQLKKDIRPSAADLRGAGSMAGDFDQIILLDRANADDPGSPIQAFVAKGKNGGNTGTSHWLAPLWVSLTTNADNDDVGAPILVPCGPPSPITDEDRHKARTQAAEDMAFEIMAAMRSKAPEGLASKTAAQDLVAGRTGVKQRAWSLLETREWVMNTGTSRAPKWMVSDKAPPPDDSRFKDAAS